MSELKTLKDIVRSKLNPFLIADFDLKAEAVKWVKKLEAEPYDVKIHAYKLGKIAIIKEFLNLTEEEIKGENK